MSTLTATKFEDKNEVIIEVHGTFDHLMHRDFRAAYRDEDADTAYVLDLHKTEYMDSAALGMLLLLREHAGGEKANICIKGCRKNILKTLTVAQFDQLFSIR